MVILFEIVNIFVEAFPWT